MNDTLHLLEQRLIAGYRDKVSRYEQALAMVGTDAKPPTGIAGITAWAPKLMDLLQDLADLDANLADDRAAWRQSGGVPGQELRELLEAAAHQLRILGEKIDGEIAQLTQRREQLFPEIERFVRQRTMLTAYAQQESAEKS